MSWRKKINGTCIFRLYTLAESPGCSFLKQNGVYIVKLIREVACSRAPFPCRTHLRFDVWCLAANFQGVFISILAFSKGKSEVPRVQGVSRNIMYYAHIGDSVSWAVRVSNPGFPFFQVELTAWCPIHPWHPWQILPQRPQGLDLWSRMPWWFETICFKPVSFFETCQTISARSSSFSFYGHGCVYTHTHAHETYIGWWHTRTHEYVWFAARTYVRVYILYIVTHTRTYI